MKKILFFLPLLFAAKLVLADPAVSISNAWARPTSGDGKQTAMYFDLKNTGNTTLKLTGVRSPLGMAMLHESMAQGGMMHMQMIEVMDIAPQQTVSFAPGHKHVMLEQLQQPLKKGDMVPLTLLFAGDGSTTIRVPVDNKPLAP